MCSPAELETALRGIMRKEPGVDCVSIAIDASSVSGQTANPPACPPESVWTRVRRSILNNLLLVQVDADGETEPWMNCDKTPSLMELLQSVIYDVDAPYALIAVHVTEEADPGCEVGCDDADVSLAELFKASLLLSDYWDPAPSVQVINTSGGGLPLDCDDITPTATLLRMAAARMPDGTVAWRVSQEL